MNIFSTYVAMLFLFMMMMIICCSIGFSHCCMDEERTALQAITESMGYGHDSYEHSYRARFFDDCCRWEGVHCSPTSSQVIGIYFYFIRKDAEDEWFLDMSLFSKLKQLQELHLVGNNIGGLDNPEAICELTNLRWLDLSINLIEDDVPRCWGNMPSLRTLDLSMNGFRGNLTYILANVSKKIEIIKVSHNIFEGFVPFSIFANLSKLSHLDLSYNYHLEVETEDPNWYPSFQIQHLLLAACNLNHQSDHVIPRFLSTQVNLQTLDLSSNSLVGKFPTWMLRNVSSVLSLRSNCFVGQLPEELENNSTITLLDISDNLFDGYLPSKIDQILPQLLGFNASSNRFSGNIPLSFGELKHLERLDLSNNGFTGTVPVNLTRNSPLWYLNLSNNSLHGKPLPGNCSMPKLAWLLLQHNLFDGEFPACLSNSLSLRLVDVRDNRLSGTISNLPALMQLGAFLVGRNRFSGQLLEQLCEMQRIQLLDFSSNGFSGNIPCCLSNNTVWKNKFQANSWVPIDFTTKGQSLSYQGIPLTLMTGIDFSENSLTGTIP
ncbi:receptor-like protein 14 isoform X1 [Hibiscus syriacus]|uniref:receptor-like protein 14 isoform X1 n=1 Tax=Hibiscus syriacus TaxID=106335 RepID=UPI001921C115|nr:receptor-like protein 14 isoform X1 [Hibiscus syriacus]